MDILEKIDLFLGEGKKAVAKGIFSQEGRKIQGTRTGKMLLGIQYDDGTVENVTMKQFMASNLDWVESQVANDSYWKKEFLQALVKQEKQFNKKVDYNSWANANKNASWEERVGAATQMMSVKYSKAGLKN
jgi:hypothetical protein